MYSTFSGQSTFKNPIIPGFHPDPSVCRVGEDYYLAVSSFEYFPGVPLFHSRDLVNWNPIGHALTRQSQLDLTGRKCSQGIFAPTLRFHDGTFYLITTDVGGRGNFFVTAKDPAGPWSDPVPVDRGWFDPSLIFDDDGRVYYTRREGQAVAQAEINIETGGLLTPLRIIAQPFASTDAEGPHLYKINGWYYLLCAEGGTGYGHMVTIGRSRSPWGPFEGCPHNPILTHRHVIPHPIRYTGHGELFQAHDGSWWFVCLGTRHNPNVGYCFHVLGRETFLAPVEWQDGWPVINEGKPLALTMPSPDLEPHPWPRRPTRDCFSSGDLGPEWTFARNPRPSSWEKVRGGGLRLWGAAETLNDRAAISFIGRRQEEFEFHASTEVLFAPTAAGEEAGLVVLASNEFHAEVFLRAEEDGWWLITSRRLLDVTVETGRRRWRQAGPIIFAVEGDLESYTFKAGPVGGELEVVGSCPTRFLSTEVATGWTGVMLGMYASGNGRACGAPADFHWFEYRNAREVAAAEFNSGAVPISRAAVNA